MKILIIGPSRIQHMKIQGVEWDNYYKLQYHITISDWYDFIDYIKKYNFKEDIK